MTVSRPSVALRPMTSADVREVTELQGHGSVLVLAEIFPQHTYPFPREQVAERWHREIEDPGIDCYVVALTGDAAGAVAGFAATRSDELLHFGVAVEHWGTDLAGEAHDMVLQQMSGQGVRRAWLRVFAGNRRGRRFYERRGWQPTGESTRSTFPPFPELLRYEREVAQNADRKAYR